MFSKLFVTHAIGPYPVSSNTAMEPTARDLSLARRGSSRTLCGQARALQNTVH
jgi:hypothetical protein